MNIATAYPVRTWLLLALGIMSAVGCQKAVDNSASPGRGGANGAAPDGRGLKTGKLTLTVDGKAVEWTLEEMQILLVKRGNAPESYDIRGTGVNLVGEFPKGVKVDYNDNWSALLGKAIPILATAGVAGEESTSSLTLPDKGECRILGGSLTVEKLLGDGGDGAELLQGKTEIKCQTPTGPKTFKGTFLVPARTYG